MEQAKELLELAIEIALSAGEIVRKGASENDFTVQTKSSATDPVTEIDQASEAYIVGQIQKRRPDDGILGEEGASKESKNGVQWVIDPIDGTTNFVYGIPFYAVSVGVAVDGVPVAGAVYNPALDELYSASTGGGAFLNGQPIHVRETRDFAVSLIATGFSYDAKKRVSQGETVAKMVGKVRDFRRLSAASLDLCNVACGRVEAYYEDRINPWDVCAGSVIVKEAGGMCTSFDDGVPLTNVIAACTPDVYNALLPYALDS